MMCDRPSYRPHRDRPIEGHQPAAVTNRHAKQVGVDDFLVSEEEFGREHLLVQQGNRFPPEHMASAEAKSPEIRYGLRGSNVGRIRRITEHPNAPVNGQRKSPNHRFRYLQTNRAPSRG